MRAPHDIIHTVTSFPWRKVAKSLGIRAPMNCGCDQEGAQSGHYSLTSTTVVHEPGETKRSPLSSSQWFMMKMTTHWVLLEDRRWAILFIACPWLMTCSRVSKLKEISSQTTPLAWMNPCIYWYSKCGGEPMPSKHWRMK